MEWARQNNRIVFTQDLDFSRMLALSGALGPSIFQIRNTDNLPDVLGTFVLRALNQCESILKAGAIVVINNNGTRARFLPLR
jgi:predicted nuclease of predicted toxin-antitoxin system